MHLMVKNSGRLQLTETHERKMGSGLY